MFFFAAERSCPIDPYWRLRETSCLPWNLFLPNNVDEKVSIRPYRLQPSRLSPSPAYDGVGFKLKFPVTIRQLGISKRVLERLKVDQVTVEIFDPNAGETHLALNFNTKLAATIPADDGYIYQPLGEETFARGFEGALRIAPGQLNGLDGLECNLVWNKMLGEDGLVPFDSLWINGASLPFTFESCPLVSMVYNIPDIQELRQMVNARDTQNKCQENRNRQMSGRVVEETEDFDDVAFFNDVLDVTEHAPIAFLRFLQWSVDNYDFEHMIVTSDESFVALDRVAVKLDGVSSGIGTKTWRAHFRNLTPVRHFGVLPEATFRSSHYPIAPTDSASIISADLAHYLARNAGDLAPFRSLSESLAVWLSSVAPEYIEDADFNGTCAGANGKRTVAMDNIADSKTMAELWRHYSTTGSLC